MHKIESTLWTSAIFKTYINIHHACCELTYSEIYFATRKTPLSPKWPKPYETIVSLDAYLYAHMYHRTYASGKAVSFKHKTVLSGYQLLLLVMLED